MLLNRKCFAVPDNNQAILMEGGTVRMMYLFSLCKHSSPYHRLYYISYILVTIPGSGQTRKTFKQLRPKLAGLKEVIDSTKHHREVQHRQVEIEWFWFYFDTSIRVLNYYYIVNIKLGLNLF